MLSIQKQTNKHASSENVNVNKQVQKMAHCPGHCFCKLLDIFHLTQNRNRFKPEGLVILLVSKQRKTFWTSELQKIPEVGG